MPSINLLMPTVRIPDHFFWPAKTEGILRRISKRKYWNNTLALSTIYGDLRFEVRECEELEQYEVVEQLKILFLNHNIKWQGTFLRCFHFGKHLAKLGHKVTLVTVSKQAEFCLQEVKSQQMTIVESPALVRGRFRNGADPWDVAQRIFYISGKSYDVIHGFDCRPNVILPALSYKVLRKAKLILDWADWWGRGGTISERSSKIYGYTLGYIETFFEEHFRSHADAMTVTSSALSARVSQLGLDNRPILKLPHGSDVESIVCYAKVAARVKLSLSKDGLILGYLGVILASDAKLLFDAFTIVRRSKPNTKLLLIGNPRIEIRRYYRGDDSAVLKPGRVPYERLSQYLSACDILLLPLKDTIANRGRWPSKVNDYLSAGRPIVSTAVGDMKALITEQEAGLLAEDTAENLADRILYLIDNPGLRKEFGENARKAAETVYAWEILAKKLEGFYFDVLES